MPDLSSLLGSGGNPQVLQQGGGRPPKMVDSAQTPTEAKRVPIVGEGMVTGVSRQPIAERGTQGFPLPLAKASIDGYSEPFVDTKRGPMEKTGTAATDIKISDTAEHIYIMAGRAVLFSTLTNSKGFGSNTLGDVFDFAFDDYPYSLQMDTRPTNATNIARMFISGVTFQQIRVRAYAGNGATLRLTSFENPVIMAFDQPMAIALGG